MLIYSENVDVRGSDKRVVRRKSKSFSSSSNPNIINLSAENKISVCPQKEEQKKKKKEENRNIMSNYFIETIA